MNKKQKIMIGIVTCLCVLVNPFTFISNANGTSAFLVEPNDWFVIEITESSTGSMNVGDQLKAVIIEKNSSFVLGSVWGETVYADIYNKSIGEDHFDFLKQDWIAVYNESDPELLMVGGYSFNIFGVTVIPVACKNLTIFNTSIFNIFNASGLTLNNSIGTLDDATYWNGDISGNGLSDGDAKIHVQVESIKHVINEMNVWSWNTTKNDWDEYTSFELYNTSWKIIELHFADITPPGFYPQTIIMLLLIFGTTVIGLASYLILPRVNVHFRGKTKTVRKKK